MLGNMRAGGAGRGDFSIGEELDGQTVVRT